jgi:type II secretory pathway component PulF
MDATLLAVAQNYDSEADSRTKAFIAVIQPAMTIIIVLLYFLSFYQ